MDRFEEKYIPEPNSGCWLWTGPVRTDGYGVMRFEIEGKIKNVSSHRVSWELHNGSIPKSEGHHGTCVLHKCDNRICVNPDHLFLGSQGDNMRDMYAKNRYKQPIKMTVPDVSNAISMVRHGATQKAVAEFYGVSQSLISRIINGKRRRLS